LDGALLFLILFSSVSMSCIFVDGFSMLKSSFSKNLCYGTLYCHWMLINVNVFLELVGLVTFTDRVRFHADPGWMHCLIIVPWFLVAKGLSLAYSMIQKYRKNWGEDSSPGMPGYYNSPLTPDTRGQEKHSFAGLGNQAQGLYFL
jgi:hypothetical protein